MQTAWSSDFKMAGKKGQKNKEKPTAPCGDCDKEVSQDEKALICCICDKWFHIKCHRVSVADYDYLQKTNESIQWFCKGCTGASQKLFKMMTLVHKRQDQMEKEIHDLAKVVNDCNKKLDKQAKSFDDMGSVITEKVHEIISDKKEEEERESNLIFFNLEEQSVDDSDDIETVVNLCSDTLGVTLTNVQIAECTRLGKRPEDPEKARPLRVKINERAVRGQILRNGYKLKDSEGHANVAVSRDLTLKQREANKTLRQELKKRKKDEPGKNWAIRRDKIVELPQPAAAVAAAGDRRK